MEHALVWFVNGRTCRLDRRRSAIDMGLTVRGVDLERRCSSSGMHVFLASLFWRQRWKQFRFVQVKLVRLLILFTVFISVWSIHWLIASLLSIYQIIEWSGWFCGEWSCQTAWWTKALFESMENCIHVDQMSMLAESDRTYQSLMIHIIQVHVRMV